MQYYVMKYNIGFAPVGVSCGWEPRPYRADTQWAVYHTNCKSADNGESRHMVYTIWRIAAFNEATPAKRRIVRTGYLPLLGYSRRVDQPLGRLSPDDGRVPILRSIVRNDYASAGNPLDLIPASNGGHTRWA